MTTLRNPAPTADIIILGCVSGKRHGPSMAKDLYDSVLFAKRRHYAECTGKPWVIFSAEHGILGPEDVIEWYDVALAKLPVTARRRKGLEAVGHLESRFGSLRGKIFEIHAGAAYVSAIAAPLTTRGARLVNPLEGLKIGFQLQWYGRQPCGEPMVGGTRAPTATVPPERAKLDDTPISNRSQAVSDAPDFRLRFDPARIVELAARYSYGAGAGYDDPALEIERSVRARGWYARREFIDLCRWKTIRSRSRVSRNSAKRVEETTRLALAADAEELRIGILCLLDGVSWPTASVLLHFGHRERYPILDYRALEALGLDQPPAYTMPFWLAYVDATRRLASDAGVDMRTLDRALWQWSKERGTQRSR